MQKFLYEGSLYCYRQKCRAMSLLSGDIRFMWIFVGFHGEGRQTTVQLSTTAIFSVFIVISSETLR